MKIKTNKQKRDILLLTTSLLMYKINMKNLRFSLTYSKKKEGEYREQAMQSVTRTLGVPQKQ